jgi:hypothetical protein
VRRAMHQLLDATSNTSFLEKVYLLLSSHSLLVLPTPLPLLIFEGKDIFGHIAFDCLESTAVNNDGSVDITHFWKYKSVGGGIRVYDSISFNEPTGKLGPINCRNIEIIPANPWSGSTLKMNCLIWVKSGRLAMTSSVGYSPRKSVWFYFQAPPIQEDVASEVDGSRDGTHVESRLSSISRR